MRSRSELSRLAAAMGGLPVLGCLEGSPAAEAGVRYGDILLAVDGIATSTWDDFLRARTQSRGRFVARIFREGTELEIAVELKPSGRTPMEMLDELMRRDAVHVADGVADDPPGDDSTN